MKQVPSKSVNGFHSEQGSDIVCNHGVTSSTLPLSDANLIQPNLT